MKYPYKKIGRRIRKLRKESHLTQAELGNHLDRHQVYISQIERGQVKPPRVLLYALSNIFRVPATQLNPDIFADGLETTGREFLEKEGGSLPEGRDPLKVRGGKELRPPTSSSPNKGVSNGKQGR